MHNPDLLHCFPIFASSGNPQWPTKLIQRIKNKGGTRFLHVQTILQNNRLMLLLFLFSFDCLALLLLCQYKKQSFFLVSKSSSFRGSRCFGLIKRTISANLGPRKRTHDKSQIESNARQTRWEMSILLRLMICLCEQHCRLKQRL